MTEVDIDGKKCVGWLVDGIVFNVATGIITTTRCYICVNWIIEDMFF